MMFDPLPTIPKAPTPGRPGEFDFLAGEWRIQHQRLIAATGAWDAFEGEATCWSILGGVGSVEELRIPARDFAGMGLRLLNLDTAIWSDFWVNAKSGALTPPGQTGSFEGGIGVFSSHYQDQSGTMLVMGVWDKITSHACRWRQAVSRDDGQSWAQNWIMEWTRVGDAPSR
jgi:hypothetical protein